MTAHERILGQYADFNGICSTDNARILARYCNNGVALLEYFGGSEPVGKLSCSEWINWSVVAFSSIDQGQLLDSCQVRSNNNNWHIWTMRCNLQSCVTAKSLYYDSFRFDAIRQTDYGIRYGAVSTYFSRLSIVIEFYRQRIVIDQL